ncbi:MAG: hypothetical protein K9L23_22260 [Desulfotignum sp.]|nr:hypothetical protein [Desulfotignum sp.]
MLDILQNLALCHLWKNLEGNRSLPDNLRQWFVQEKNKDPGRFFNFLVEPSGKIEKYYTLSQSPDDEHGALLESASVESLGINAAAFVPFNKPSGPRSPQIGPVIKRSYNKQKGPGPTLQIITSTLNKFEEFSKSEDEWAGYFKECHRVFSHTRLHYAGKLHECNHNAFHTAVEIIPESPVFLVFKTQGGLPGQISEYKNYLATMLDGKKKYALAKAKPVDLAQCPCCGEKNVKGFAAGMSKAEINIFNFNRVGAFPGLTNKNAHLSYAICEHCADLLYVYKFHVNHNFITYLAGQESLMIPELYSDSNLMEKFIQDYQAYISELASEPQNALKIEQLKLVRLFKRQPAVCSVDVIWSSDSLKGQSIKNLSGRITDVLPSRLKQIDSRNRKFKEINSPVFPIHPIEEFQFNLNCSFLSPLLKRPGGKKAGAVNASRKLIELKRLMVEAIYKNKTIPTKRFEEEIITTARWYLLSVLEKEAPERDCLREGFSSKKNESWWTFAGWIRHLAWALSYLHDMEVMIEMENQRTYVPEMKDLEPYFSEESGITSNEKAFAFILGILFGRVLAVQGAKGVNVSANALTWLKRLTLTGKDLPGFYVKIREKLLAYDAEGNAQLREVIREAGTLGSLLGDTISLGQTSCCYFILLGQSIASDLFSTIEKTNP